MIIEIFYLIITIFAFSWLLGAKKHRFLDYMPHGIGYKTNISYFNNLSIQNDFKKKSGVPFI